jgi:hypothetical protein
VAAAAAAMTGHGLREETQRNQRRLPRRRPHRAPALPQALARRRRLARLRLQHLPRRRAAPLEARRPARTRLSLRLRRRDRLHRDQHQLDKRRLDKRCQVKLHQQRNLRLRLPKVRNRTTTIDPRCGEAYRHNRRPRKMILLKHPQLTSQRRVRLRGPSPR